MEFIIEFFSEYIKNFKCQFKEVNIETKIQGDYLYYCDKYFNISKLKNLTFQSKFQYDLIHDDI